MSRLDPKEREEQLLKAALQLAVERGYTHVTRADVAGRAEVSPALISVRLGSMPSFRRKLMRYAVRVRCLKVIAQGLVARDPHAMKASIELKAEALAAVA